MDLKLKGKTALVTGGSEGIGKGIALMLAKEGVDVAICARRKEPLEATAKEIAKETGRKIVPIPADLRQDAEAKNFIEQAHKALGRVDIMVNNAGSAAGGVIEHLTEDDWEKGLQLKFMGYVRCLRYVLPIMVKQGGGRVVNRERPTRRDRTSPSRSPASTARTRSASSRSTRGRSAPSGGRAWSRQCRVT
jgi:NADP-dependent 3-hydroxy acid dehydrogenase YdfG